MTTEPLRATGRANRAEPRQRVRLQTAKVSDERNNFLTFAQFFDRSANGARLRIAEAIVLPRKIRLYDEASNQTCDATIAWQRGQEIGVRIKAWSGRKP